jgi:ABC-type transport system involved in cytochrome bd biosynthesis fused ATPase/permease subunit
MLRQSIASLFGVVGRVSDLMLALEQVDAAPAGVAAASDSAVTIELFGADVVAPDGRCVARDLSVTIRQGQHLAITGGNAAGKSAIFRVLGRLWPLRTGRVSAPGRSLRTDPTAEAAARGVGFVPQVRARRAVDPWSTPLFMRASSFDQRADPSASGAACRHGIRRDGL